MGEEGGRGVVAEEDVEDVGGGVVDCSYDEFAHAGSILLGLVNLHN